MKTNQSFEFFGMQPPQKIAKGGIGGEPCQTQQTLKRSVVGQDASIGDPFESGHHAVDQAQEQLGTLVRIDAPTPGNIALEEALQVEFSTKLLKQQHPAVMGEGGILE